jgi:hypothetical protein
MYKKMSWLFLLALVLSSSACFLSSSGSVQPTSAPAPAPAGGRLGQINGELGAIEQQIAAKYSERAICEDQRNQSLLELGKATGMGPKPPGGNFEEELTDDPGMLISMHNQNMSVAIAEIKRIDNEINALNQRAAQLRNERIKLEQAAKPPSTPADGPGGCFTPDTAVLMERGGKAIVNIAPGESVMVYDETSGRIGYRPVVNVFRFEETHYYLLNQTLRATSLHRFMTDSGWVPVKDLKIGMQLKTAEGWKVLESKMLIAAPVAVFNLEVAEHHNFFIDDGTDRYLVHNTGGGGK